MNLATTAALPTDRPTAPSRFAFPTVQRLFPAYLTTSRRLFWKKFFPARRSADRDSTRVPPVYSYPSTLTRGNASAARLGSDSVWVFEWVDRPIMTRRSARGTRRDAARPRAALRHTQSRPRTTSNDLSRVMPDVMCGTCAEAPAAVVRVESQTGVALCACARCDTRCARARCVADSNAAVARHPWVG